MKKFLALIFIIAFTSACTAVESARMAKSQTIVVNTPMADGAQCTVKDNRGTRWFLRKTPEDVTIKSGHAPLTVTCTRKGFKKTIVQIGDEKKNLLKLGDERLMPEISGEFVSKTPRLIPGVLEETAGFANDPFASIATQFPSQIAVWMEPLEWESEEEMRAWYFEKRIYENQLVATAENKAEEESEYLAKKEAKQIAKSKENRERWERVKTDVVKTVMDPVQKIIVDPYEQLSSKIKNPETYSWFWRTKRQVTPKVDWIKKREVKETVELKQVREAEENKVLLRNDQGFSMDSE